MNFAAIDFETANAKRSSACSVGVCVVTNGTITEIYSELIRPVPYEFNYYNTLIHGLTEKDVRNAPAFATVWEEVLAKTGDLPLVAHNAAFDMSVIRHALDVSQRPYPSLDYICTLLLSKHFAPELKSHRLDYLSDLYGIDLIHHQAESDAIACAELLLHMTSRLNLHSIDEVTNILEPGTLYHWPEGNGYSPCRLRK